MNKIIIFLLAYIFLPFHLFAQSSIAAFEKTSSFYPNVKRINNDNIEWGYLTVPENWENKNGNNIKLAITILKNSSGKTKTNPVIMIDGGPGAGSIEGIWYWLNHPLRKNSDIVLMDARGTGFSKPRLCPELGKKFLQILAKNQNASKDEEEKAVAAMACKQQLISRGIDINTYNSTSISKDLHALKEILKYKDWNVYGVSYGTYVAQVYANIFPKDIKTLVLDSPISNINEYYVYNTSNYVSSLEKVFKACKDNPQCDTEYPNLKKVYYETIQKLTKEPITVSVEKSIIESEEFTYNAEDFKVAIQQALYNKRLIELLPLLIYQFHDENKDALSSLVAAFSGALGLDYGMYYCVSCNEVIPKNSINKYLKDAEKYKELKGSLSFYKSDFVVCDKWNADKDNYIKQEIDTVVQTVSTLIVTGEFDPITPASNGTSLISKFSNGTLIKARSYGHASSFSKSGFSLVNKFINTPNEKISDKDFKSKPKVNFVNNIHINGAISKLGNSINNFNVLFFSPLIIALIISLIAFFIYTISLLRNRKVTNKLLKVLLGISSILGSSLLVGFILALKNTASDNFYILAFGLSEKYNYLFTILYVFLVLLLLTIVFFILNMRKINNRSVIFTVLFSNLLIGVYFLYWGFI